MERVSLFRKLEDVTKAVDKVQPYNDNADFVLGQIAVIEIELLEAKQIVLNSMKPRVEVELLNKQVDELKGMKHDIIKLLNEEW